MNWREGFARVALALIDCGHFVLAHFLLTHGFGIDPVPAAGVSVVWALGGKPT